jgi:hypothetical protein
LSNTEQLHTQRWLRGHDLLCWELGKTFWNMCIAVNMVFAMIYSTAVSSIWQNCILLLNKEITYLSQQHPRC